MKMKSLHKIDDFFNFIYLQKISKKILVNKYIPKYVPKDFTWYEREGLMTYIDQLKYKRFKENRDEDFKNTEIVNCDIINH